MQPLPHTRSCFVCGESNPLGLQLRFETDGKMVRAQFCPRAQHIGFKETLHGGIIATVLDETMVWACALEAKRFVYCAELTVRYLHPIRPGASLIASSRMVESRRDKLFTASAELAASEQSILA